MAKLERNRYIVYIDASFGGETPNWFKIGKNLTGFTVELNPDTSSEKNIWLETYTTDNGYAPSASVDTYYANPEDAIYDKLFEIAMDRLTGDACKTKIMEVVVENDEAEAYSAWTEDIIVKPTSTGGDTSGFAIPYSISFDGGRERGKVSYDAGGYMKGTPSFTPNTGA